MAGRDKKTGEPPADAADEKALIPHPQFSYHAWNREPRSNDAPQPRRLGPGTPPHVQELDLVWMQLGTSWSSVVVVPCEPNHPTAEIGRALTQAGARLSVYPVEFLDATVVDPDGSSRLIARLQMSRSASRGSPGAAEPFASASWTSPITRTIVALESPLANPLVIPIALASDGVVLCVRRGRDRIASVRKTISALGAHLIRCCVLLEESAGQR